MIGFDPGELWEGGAAAGGGGAPGNRLPSSRGYVAEMLRGLRGPLLLVLGFIVGGLSR